MGGGCVVKLYETAAGAGQTLLSVPTVKMAEVTNLPLWSLAPYAGAGDKAAEVLGMDLPSPGRFEGKNPMLAWFGYGHYMLLGRAPDVGLADHCAVVDQTDGWAVFDVSGPQAMDVLARLTPLDLRPNALANGSAVRTELAHMQGAVLRMRKDRFRIMVFRSMAGTLVHDLNRAVQSVSAQMD